MDPDLQIRQGRGGAEVCGSHPGTEISRGAVSKKIFWGALGPQFGLKIRGGLLGPPGPSPGPATVEGLCAKIPPQ